jgi:cysteine-rich repeat protein
MVSWEEHFTTVSRKSERALADTADMRCQIPDLIAKTALMTLASCTSPSGDPPGPVSAGSVDGGLDASVDCALPIILNDGFALPHSDARSDVPTAPAPAPTAWPDSGSTPDSPYLEASATRTDAKISDACTLATCVDADVWTGLAQCDSTTDGRATFADADADADADISADAARETASAAAFCGNGIVDPGELCDDGNADEFDACSNRCQPAAGHLIITEIVTRPSGAEMVEIHNPTASPVELSDYALSDSHQYFTIASGSFSTASGSDFVAFFPSGSQIPPGSYRTVAIANGSGAETSFESAFGKKPDFELRPKANGAIGDPLVPDMQPVPGIASIGALASLTDSGEIVILFRYGSGSLVYDVDYVFFGSTSTANPAVDKTGVVVLESAYQSERAGSLQQPAPAPGDGGALHRCIYSEGDEVKAGGNGATCHDETSEAFSVTFARSTNAADQRTPGGPPPAGLCP